MPARLVRYVARYVIAPVVMLGLVVAMPSDRQPASAQTAEDPTLLRELAQRLLTPAYRPPNTPVPTVQLLPGAPPPGLNVALDFSGARLVGSAVRSGGDPSGGSSIDIIADVDQPAAAVAANFQAQFKAAGWIAPEYGPGPRGFQQSSPTLEKSFCKTDGGFANVVAIAKDTGHTDLRINIHQSAGRGPCGNAGIMPPQKPTFPPGYELMPLLTPPADVPLQTTGGGGGPGQWTSDAVATTGRSSAELAAHFAGQLEAAGWKRTGGATDGLAWSTWTVAGDGGPSSGLLFVLDGPGKDQRVLHVRVISSQTSPFPMGKLPPATTVAPPPMIAP